MKRLLWPILFAMMLAALVLPGTSRAQGPDQGPVDATRLNLDRMEQLRQSSPNLHSKAALPSATAAAPLGKELPMDSPRMTELRKLALSRRAATSHNPFASAPSSPAAGNGIYGTVKIQGEPANNIPVQLRLLIGTSDTAVQEIRTQSDGTYEFLNVPTLPANQSYYVRFENWMRDTKYLSAWFSYGIASYTAGTNVAGGDFDISNIVLSSPLPSASAAIPATFQWTARPAAPTDSYMIDLFSLTFDPYWQSPAQGFVNSYALNDLPSGFSYDVKYYWGVVTEAPDGGAGFSYYCHEIILTHPGIYGTVRYFSQPAANVPLELRFWNGSVYITVATTQTRSNGSYTFADAASLAAGQSYYVRYVNSTQAVEEVGAWFSYDIETYAAGTNVAGGDFNVEGITLLSPAHGAKAVVPTEFQWLKRTWTEGDSYVLELFSLTSNKGWLTPPLGYNNAYTLEKLPTGMSFGVRYGWAMLVLAPDGGMGGSYWAHLITFTPPPLPAAFGKTSPVKGASAQPLTLDLKWAASKGAVSYEYCYDRSNDNVCTGPAKWVSAGTNLTATIGPLTPGAAYFWQVRAVNAGGAKMADAGTWWSLKTQAMPGAFSKSYPANLATLQSIAPTLQWRASTSATGYEYCIDTTDDNSCEGNIWVSTGTARSVNLSNLNRGTTYFWQVRSTNSLGTKEANVGAWWKFTTAQNLLKNPGFEADANADGKPDNWTSNARFTRTVEQFYEGSYAGRFFAADNSAANTGQAVGGIKPGKPYHFSGWVNIPATADTFTFSLKIKWRNSLGAVVGTTNLKTYSAATPGWDQVGSDVTAPVGAARAEISMAATSLNATIYVDNFELWW